jgi:hypothetical protein
MAITASVLNSGPVTAMICSTVTPFCILEMIESGDRYLVPDVIASPRKLWRPAPSLKQEKGRAVSSSRLQTASP